MGHRGNGRERHDSEAADGTDGKKARRTRTDAPDPDATRQPDRERRLVDVDPWAILLEQLMEVPEESAPAERKRGKRE